MAFGNQDAVEADVIHDDTVRQVVDVELDAVVEAVAVFDPQRGDHRRAGADDQLGRFEPHDHLRLGPRRNAHQATQRLGDPGVADLGFGGDLSLRGIVGGGLRHVGRGGNDGRGAGVPGFDRDRARDREARRQPGDLNLDLAFEAVAPLGGEGDLLAAAGVHRGAGAADGHAEIGLRPPDEQAISETVAA